MAKVDIGLEDSDLLQWFNQIHAGLKKGNVVSTEKK